MEKREEGQARQNTEWTKQKKAGNRGARVTKMAWVVGRGEARVLLLSDLQEKPLGRESKAIKEECCRQSRNRDSQNRKMGKEETRNGEGTQGVRRGMRRGSLESREVPEIRTNEKHQ